MTFDEILEAMRNGGEGVDYGTLADQLAEQATQMAASVKAVQDGFTATLAEKDSAIATFQTEKAALQAHNYKLMMSAADSEPLKSENNNPTPDITGVDDLFKEAE